MCNSCRKKFILTLLRGPLPDLISFRLAAFHCVRARAASSSNDQAFEALHREQLDREAGRKAVRCQLPHGQSASLPATVATRGPGVPGCGSKHAQVSLLIALFWRATHLLSSVVATL